MPAIGARGPMPALPTRAPTPAKVALPPILPPPARSTGSVGSAVSGAARGHSLQFASPPPKAAPIRVSRAEGGHGLAQASARQEMGSHAPTGAAYHQAVAATFLHQSTKGQAAILRNMHAADPVTRAAVHDALNSLGGSQKLALASQFKQPGVGQEFSNTLGSVERGLLSLHNSATQGPTGQLNTSGFGAGPLAKLAVQVPLDVARATAESPATLPKTVKGLGEAAVGGLAGLVQLPVKAVENGPGQAFSQLYHGMAADYGRRYGPLLAGNDRAFINRIKQQGAGPEALDALGLVGGVDATVGRAAVDTAKAASELTGKEAATGFLTRPRPGLRVAGGDVRPQNLAATAGRVTVQRLEDKLRAAKESGTLPLTKPGEIKTNPGEVRPLFGNRSQRVMTSFIASKYRNTMQNVLNTHVRQGAARDLSRLSRWERRAAPVVQEGFVPLDRGVQAAKDAITARIASIKADRAASPLSPGNHIPPEFAKQIDELHNLQALHDNAGKWLTPRLSKFVHQEGARAPHIETSMPDSYLRAPVAEARRLRPQGEMLGIEHPDVANARLTGAAEVAGRGKPKALGSLGADLNRERRITAASSEADKHANYDHTRLGLLQDYSAKVRAAAKEKGLPEPSYIPHSDVPASKLGNYTSGSGHGAMPGPKQSTFALWRGGAVDRNPEMYTNGLARAIKSGHQWPLVDEQLRRAGLPEPSARAIEAAGFGGRRADTLTGREYTRAMMFDGHKAENMTLYNPGRLRESTMEERGLATTKGSRAGSAGAPPELTTDAHLHGLMNEHAIQGADLTKEEGLPVSVRKADAFVKDTGWKALPPAAYKEIHSSLQPSQFGGRLAGKVQGGAGRLILGGSPSFLVMNTLAHMVLATFGTRGRILSDAVKYPMWWHGLTEEERNIVRSHAGGRAPGGVERLGSTAPHALAESWKKLKDAGIGRFQPGRVVAAANPFHMLFKAEDFQSNHFRQMVFYNSAKRAALNSMTKDMALGASAAQRLQHVFTLGPKERMLGQIANMHTAEELGRRTVDMMGDYSRFTNFERKFINNRAVLFYSFMRHAARTLFYVLPLHHPIATALVGEMAKLHNDEVKKMLGGADLPYAYSRLYFTKGGKLTSIDFARSSPIGSIGADLPNEGIAGAAKVIPPEVQPVLNEIYGRTPTGSPVQTNVWSLLNSIGSMSYPYRLTQELHDGTKLQQSDSVPWVHERPQVKKTVAAQAYQAAKEAASGPLSQKVLAGLFGIIPKPDDIGVVAAHQNTAAASKARNAAGGGALPGAPSGSSGGGFLMGSGSSGGSSGGYLMK